MASKYILTRFAAVRTFSTSSAASTTEGAVSTLRDADVARKAGLPVSAAGGAVVSAGKPNFFQRLGFAKRFWYFISGGVAFGGVAAYALWTDHQRMYNDVERMVWETRADLRRGDAQAERIGRLQAEVDALRRGS
jgi:hypothetical protein|tara:strand:- start:266 stop:670 length:405 start_codon:yes stop_codon:yes gene_type:complete